MERTIEERAMDEAIAAATTGRCGGAMISFAIRRDFGAMNWSTVATWIEEWERNAPVTFEDRSGAGIASWWRGIESQVVSDV